MYSQMTAQLPVGRAYSQLSYLFDKGMTHFGNEEWREAERVFSDIIAQKSSYRENGRSAKEMLKVARNEREAREALAQGELRQALSCFREAGNLERIVYVEDLIHIDDLEQRALTYTEAGRYRQAAWVYEQLLRDFGEDSRSAIWRDAQTTCWREELVPIFDAGFEAYENKNWHKAKDIFSEVVCADPDFRRHGRSAAVMLDQSRQEIRQIADAAMNSGNVDAALKEYQGIMEMDRITQIEKIIHLQNEGEKAAQEYIREGKLAKAAAVYEWLTTLKLDTRKKQQFKELALKFKKNARLRYLFEKGMTAIEQKDWAEAKKRFGEAKELDPKFRHKGQRIAHLYRVAVLKHQFRTLFPQS